MKICHFEIPTALGPMSRLGILNQTEVIDLNLIWQRYFAKQKRFNPQERAHHHLPSSLAQVLALKENPLDLFRETLELFDKLKQSGDGEGLTFKAPRLLCPLDKINSYRDFYAHEKHVKTGFAKRQEEVPPAWYEMPVYYKGSTSGFIGPDAPILWPRYSDKLDYELELAAVISREGKNIKASQAVEHILGFSILNDISARDIQKKEMSVRLGPAKGKDFCSILGPVITTIDEFNGVEPNLKMTAKINGELWSQGQSRDATFNFSQMIEHASQEEWLLPGDLLGSGTVGTGCGLELDRWIQPGDTIELEVESIGVLKNTVGKKNESL